MVFTSAVRHRGKVWAKKSLFVEESSIFAVVEHNLLL